MRLVGCPPVGGLCGKCHWLSPHRTYMPSGCGRRCATLSRWTGSLWWPTTRLTISHRSVVARVQPPGDGPPPARALRPLKLGQVESLRRIARLRLGLPAAEERAAGPPMAAPGAGGGNPATSPASSFASPSKARESEVPSNRVSSVKSVTTMVHGSPIRRLHWGSERSGKEEGLARSSSERHIPHTHKTSRT